MQSGLHFVNQKPTNFSPTAM
ncbi:unnamed protein product, partial [Vitis vinifera]|uniref:Uncharacterized protein n=1 Tax=Vitis vinifera TaxID=29760 RepID=D7TZR6_VITVI